MAEEIKLNEIQTLLLESSEAFGNSIGNSLNNIFGCEFTLTENVELVTRLKTVNPHVIVMGFSNEDYQAIMFLSFGNIAILEEFDLSDADLIQDPFGEVANQSIGLFNDIFTKFGHMEQAPPMYSNANSTSFPLSAGIINKLVSDNSDEIEFGYSVKAMFKPKPIVKTDSSDTFVGLDLSDFD